jgi:hypothetical protein
MFFIVLECIILIFAGSVTTLETSTKAYISFPDYLIILYAVDVTWLVSIQIMSWLGKQSSMQFFRPMIRGDDDMAPFEWAAVNMILAGFTLPLGLLGHPAKISDCTLYVLVAANAVIFLWDVVKIGHGIRDRAA